MRTGPEATPPMAVTPLPETSVGASLAAAAASRSREQARGRRARGRAWRTTSAPALRGAERDSAASGAGRKTGTGPRGGNLEAARNGIGPDAWRNFSAFLGKLDDAIAQQQLIVSDSRQRTVQGQQEWVDQRNKVKAFDTLSHRHHSEQARKEAKQEQRLTDEHAAKQFRDRTDEE